MIPIVLPHPRDQLVEFKHTVQTGTTITITHDVLKSQLLNPTAARNNTGPVKVATILHSLITARDRDVAKLNLYHSQAYRFVKYKIVFKPIRLMLFFEMFYKLLVGYFNPYSLILLFLQEGT